MRETKFSTSANLVEEMVPNVNPWTKYLYIVTDLSIAPYSKSTISVIIALIYFIFIYLIILFVPFRGDQSFAPKTLTDFVDSIRTVFFFQPETDPERLVFLPIFYFSLASALFATYLYFIFCVYLKKKYISPFQQKILFIASEIVSVPMYMYHFSMLASSITCFATTKKAHSLIISALSIYSMPACFFSLMRAMIDIRMIPLPYTTVHCQNCLTWLTTISLFQVLLSILSLYQNSNILYLFFSLIFLIGSYLGVYSSYHPFCRNILLCYISSALPSSFAFSALMGIVGEASTKVSKDGFLSVHFIGHLLVILLYSIPFSIKITKAKKILNDNEPIDFVALSDTDLFYILSLADPNKDQNKFPINLANVVIESRPGNFMLMLYAMSFKMYDKRAHLTILRLAEEYLRINPSYFFASMKLMNVMEITSGAVIINDDQAICVKVINQLLSPCYKHIVNLWDAVPFENIDAVAREANSLARLSLQYSSYFKSKTNFSGYLTSFIREVTFDYSDENDGQATLEMVRKSQIANSYRAPYQNLYHWVVIASILIQAFFGIATICSVLSKSDYTFESSSYFNDLNLALNLLTSIGEAVGRSIIYKTDGLRTSIENMYEDINKTIMAERHLNMSIMNTFMELMYTLSGYDLTSMFDDNTTQALFIDAAQELINVTNEMFDGAKTLKSRSKDAVDSGYHVFYIHSIIVSIVYVACLPVLIFSIIKSEQSAKRISSQILLLDKLEAIAWKEQYESKIDEKTTERRTGFSVYVTEISVLLICYLVTGPCTIFTGYVVMNSVELYSNTVRSVISYTIASPVLMNLMMFIPAMGCSVTTPDVIYKATADAIHIILRLCNINTTSDTTPYGILNPPKYTPLEETSLFPLGDEQKSIQMICNVSRVATNIKEFLIEKNHIPASLYQKRFVEIVDVLGETDYVAAAVSYKGAISVSYSAMLIVVLVVIWVLVAAFVIWKCYDHLHTYDGLIKILVRIIAHSLSSKAWETGDFCPNVGPPVEQYNQLLESIPMGIIFYNDSELISWTNETADELYGIELKGLSINRILQNQIMNNSVEHLDVKDFINGSFPSPSYIKPYEKNFMIVHNITSTTNMKNQHRMLLSERSSIMSTGASLSDTSIRIFRHTIIVSASILSGNVLQRLQLRREAQEYIDELGCIFMSDITEFSFVVIFNQTDESRQHQREAMGFAIFLHRLTVEMRLDAKVSVLPGSKIMVTLHAWRVPTLTFISEGFIAGAMLLAVADSGQIAAEKNVVKGFMSSDMEIVRNGTLTAGFTGISYVIIETLCHV